MTKKALPMSEKEEAFAKATIQAAFDDIFAKGTSLGETSIAERFATARLINEVYSAKEAAPALALLGDVEPAREIPRFPEQSNGGYYIFKDGSLVIDFDPDEGAHGLDVYPKATDFADNMMAEYNEEKTIDAMDDADRSLFMHLGEGYAEFAEDYSNQEYAAKEYLLQMNDGSYETGGDSLTNDPGKAKVFPKAEAVRLSSDSDFDNTGAYGSKFTPVLPQAKSRVAAKADAAGVQITSPEQAYRYLLSLPAGKVVLTDHGLTAVSPSVQEAINAITGNAQQWKERHENDARNDRTAGELVASLHIGYPLAAANTEPLPEEKPSASKKAAR